MKKAIYPNLFKPMKLKGLRLKNRITMAPLYLGYAASGGTVSPLLLYHYKLMAQSGAAMIVVENASITAGGSGSARTIRCDHNRYLPGLEKLAVAIKDQKSRACLQLNMVPLAGAVKKKVKVPVIAAGRISTPARAESILKAKKADLVGLARVLWVDPQWPQKARKGQDRGILYCSPKCDACMQLVMQGKPAFCPRWTREKRSVFLDLYR